jgi:hypothetical protein
MSLVEEELLSIQGSSSTLDPKDVVAFAVNQNTSLHHCFDWDDSSAGRKYREVQARALIRRFNIVINDAGRGREVRAYVKIKTAPQMEIGYERTADVLADPAKRLSLLLDLLKRMRSSALSYQLPELEPVLAAIAQAEADIRLALPTNGKADLEIDEVDQESD